jgi:hypothetical protein
MPTPRKIAVTLLLMLMILATVPPSVADASVTTTHQTVNETVRWMIPAGQCPNIPAGVSLTGSGERHEIINTTTNADGSQKITTNDLVVGTAVDSNGGSYHFVYSNHNIKDVPASGSPIHVSMTDSFVLNGSGSIGHMAIGFNWRWNYIAGGSDFPPAPGITDWVQISTRGDISCDPI